MDKPKNLKELKKRLQPFVNMDNQVRLSQEMINAHLEVLEGNSGNKTFMPYYDRLVTLLTVLEAGWE